MFNLEYLRHVKSVYALRVPVYYYVKTKGSLVSQGLSLTKTIKMKRMVFEYYHDFYKSVLTEEDYEKNRLYVYRFLLAAAGDGAVPLSIFPGAVRSRSFLRTITWPWAFCSFCCQRRSW